LVRDFDEERQERISRPRSFKIGGEVFTFLRGLRPEDFNEIASEYFGIDPNTNQVEAIRIVDGTINGFLESEDDQARWARLRARREDAVTGRDMRAVLEMIFEEQTGHPTKLPEPSGNGDESTGESLTESSSSDPVESVASVD
jgi:hypothetical protein